MSEEVAGQGAHVFGQTRPSHSGDYTLHGQQVRVTSYRELPDPTGPAPYHLDLQDVLAPEVYADVEANQRLVFHLNGDVGGIGQPMQQQLVATFMEADLKNPVDGSTQEPAFLYLAGDCVYFNGEASQYYAQFYEPYEYYNAPIFAVPGNHDGENVEGDDSLAGFVKAFCAEAPTHLDEAGESPRTSMTQPNVYWTLTTPVASIVGLYSNVPASGEIKQPQVDWLVNELKTLPADLPILVALHHPVYSADDHHSGSTTMKQLLADAATTAGREPDMILAGHVHDYQRLTKVGSDGRQTPYLITGAGGYPNLHPIQHVNGEKMVPPVIFDDKDDDPVTLEAYSDDHHGFLRVELTKDLFVGRYYTVPRPQEPYSKGTALLDYFEFDFTTRTYRPNHLP